MKVLVVEDDPDVIETIMSVLEGFFENINVVHISHGNQFKKGEWRQGGWDLVILDLMIPGLTGFEVCEVLRSYSKTKNVPILALTGYDTLQNEQRIKKVGATSYMAKPFDVKVFLDQINKLVKK